MRLFHHQRDNGVSAIEESHTYLHTAYCWGVFDGARITLQVSPDEQEWFDVVMFRHKQVHPLRLGTRYFRAVLDSVGTKTCVNLLVE